MNPTNNTVIGKVTMADEIDTRQAIAAAREAFNTFSQSSKEYRTDCLQRLPDAVAKRMDQLVDATVLEYWELVQQAVRRNRSELTYQSVVFPPALQGDSATAESFQPELIRLFYVGRKTAYRIRDVVERLERDA